MLLCSFALGCAGAARAQAQQQQAPLTNEEFLAVVRQLSKRPSLKEQLIEDLRRRGIGFPLTPGLRSFVATRSGNDADLRRALEEAERRRLNPGEAALLPPSAAEAESLLAKTRAATLEAAERMPDFVVKQLVTRSYARGRTQNWVTSDRLTVGVSYRVEGGEHYRLLAVNGIASPASAQSDERSDYSAAGGTNSTGEFVTALKSIFSEEARAQFRAVETASLRGRRTIVYEYEVKRPNSIKVLAYNNERSVVVGHRGRLWVDRELGRVLRVESDATEIPADFPVVASRRELDYDWVKIEGQGEYLLPSRAVLVMTVSQDGEVYQSRNDIRFRGYQKYGTELRIIEDDILDEEVPAEKPSEKPPKP